MKQQITDHIHDPEALERLYRQNRRDFTREFPSVAGADGSDLARFWKIRLQYEAGSRVAFSLQELSGVIAIMLLTAILIKLPVVFTRIDETAFYLRDFAIITFNGLILYTFHQNSISRSWRMGYGAAVVVLLLYVNFLPFREGDSLTIVFIHVPLFLWCLFGASYISFDFRNAGKKMDFIRHNGELLTMTGLLLIAGAMLTGITIGLFEAIGIQAEKTYAAYVAIPGAAASPVLASYLIRLYPDITRRIVPVMARVFTPVVLATLVIYLVALAFSGIRILEDRNILILFNVMLVAVTAIIVFSVTELDRNRNRNIHVMILLILAIVTLVINSIALTAIVSRLTYGLTPNRVVVLVTNLLVFINLVLIAKDLFRTWSDARRLALLEKTAVNYLVVYFAWTILAIFLLPLLFRYR
ncbi:MAG TPA: hypothetical protein PLK82_02760 [Bacteroidales bacterium]|nr:hypothetical protein [Bacteroidales bacterium]